MIQASDAYQDGGLIVINFDEGGFTETESSSGLTIHPKGSIAAANSPA